MNGRRRQLTPAAERAIAAGFAWSWAPESGMPVDGLPAPALLLGLLAESESRAAKVLTSHGIDQAAVQKRFPTLALAASSAKGDWSLDVEASVVEVEQRLADYPRALQIATEHLLLGLAAARHETGRWLQEQGVSAEDIEREIHRLHGHDATPIDAGELLAMPARATPAPIAPRSAPTTEFGPAAATSSPMPPTGVHRLLDAAANRAREGLRVLEDYARFVLDDRHLTRELKTVRHELTVAVGRLDGAAMLACRDTPGDVGATVSTPGEFSREDLAAVVTANSRRLQEALRSLEEFGKLVDVPAARDFERARYRAYTLEQALRRTAASLSRLAAARLYVLIDGCETPAACERLAARLVQAGVHVLQLRDKKLGDRDLVERARRVRDATRDSCTLFVMNDRPDLAALVEADGVHVGQDELTVAQARAIVGPRALVGVSTHSLEQARQAVLAGADYIGVGPTFASRTKAFCEFPGLDLVRQVAEEIRLPAFAIGGIDAGNTRQVLVAGLPRIAVAHAVAGAPDPGAAAREFLALLCDPARPCTR